MANELNDDKIQSPAESANSGKAAIFDLDGTLLDSMGVWAQVDIDFFADRGIDMPDDYMATVATMQSHQVAQYTKERFGLPDSVKELAALWDGMAYTAYATDVQPKPHALEYVRALRESGAALAVATALAKHMYEPAMKHVGLDGYFHECVSVGDAGDVDKSSPDVYLLTAERLGVEPGLCTVFEDRITAVRAARAAGMQVWAVLDEHSRDDWLDLRREADGVLTDFAQAPMVL